MEHTSTTKEVVPPEGGRTAKPSVHCHAKHVEELTMKDYLIRYVWRGDLEVEAESEEDAMEQMYSMMDGCGGDPRALFDVDDEEFKAIEI